MKTQQSPVILDLRLRKPRTGKSHDNLDYIVFEKLRFQNVFRPRYNENSVFSNSSGLKNVSIKLRFRDGLVWTVGQTVEIKLRFSNSSGLRWSGFSELSLMYNQRFALDRLFTCRCSGNELLSQCFGWEVEKCEGGILSLH